MTLELDPLTAPVVRRIFEEYLGGSGLQAIAEGLTADGILRPSAYDPQRNPHHSGSAWSKATVRAIITNRRYAAPYPNGDPTVDCSECRRCCLNRDPVALVPVEVYRQSRDLLAARGCTTMRDAAVGGRRPQGQPSGRYMLRGLLRCDLCQRLMQGTRNNGAAYYRCRFPREYARANSIDHPANVYLREDRLIEPLLEWICRSLPVYLQGWAKGQSPAARIRLLERVQGLRELVTDAHRDHTRSAELYTSLSMRLSYDPQRNVVRVHSEVLPGAVVQGDIAL